MPDEFDHHREEPMTWTPPTPEEQVLFLRNIQRLLAEGQFVASYKFALLLALADLAVLKGDDSGAPLPLSTRDIAEKFIELYWQQCRPTDSIRTSVSRTSAGATAMQRRGSLPSRMPSPGSRAACGTSMSAEVATS